MDDFKIESIAQSTKAAIAEYRKRTSNRFGLQIGAPYWRLFPGRRHHHTGSPWITPNAS
jgi:hypothetical protein